MRIVEPRNYIAMRKPRVQKRHKLMLVVVAFIFAVFGYSAVTRGDSLTNDNGGDADTSDDKAQIVTSVIQQPEPMSNTEVPPPIPPPASAERKFRIFSGNEFRSIYDNLLQPNLDAVDVPPSISGNDVADTRIRQIAEQRGYRLRSSPTVKMSNIQGYPLQQVVHQPWSAIQASAAKAGLSMRIVSAFRSVEDQRALFLSRLSAQGASIESVAAGQADAAVNEVLVTSSIPGYSKHHTGYTLDIECAGFAFEDFISSPCHDWMQANNYENAKTYGFIPSYPEDASLQGPDPEAWEYVYVGSNLLYE